MMTRLLSLLKYTLLVSAILPALSYFYVALLRITYPFELEWMEGAMVDVVGRILDGEKIYMPPSLEFVPFIYAPFYFYFSAGVAQLLTPGFTALRLVSFISSMGSFLVIYLIVQKETKNNYCALLASCLFAATFNLSGAWFDLGRPDSLFLLLLLLAQYWVRFGTSRRSQYMTGVFFLLSFLTKQTAVVISLPMMFYSAIRDRGRSIYWIGTFVVIVAATTIVLDIIHDGWYSYFTLDLPGQHGWRRRMLLHFWKRDLFYHLPVACLLSLLYLFDKLWRTRLNNSTTFYFFLTVGMLGGSWLSRLHAGGFRNVLFPAYAVISILFGLGIHRLLVSTPGQRNKKQRTLVVGAYLACVYQFGSLVYNPASFIPSQEDVKAGRGFIDGLAKVEGNVLIPSHGYLSTLAGKKRHAHGMAIIDVFKGEDEALEKELGDDIIRAIRGKQFGAIVLDDEWYLGEVETHYRRQGPVFDSATVFWPVAGRRMRPKSIYVPELEGSTDSKR